MASTGLRPGSTRLIERVSAARPVRTAAVSIVSYALAVHGAFAGQTTASSVPLPPVRPAELRPNQASQSQSAPAPSAAPAATAPVAPPLAPTEETAACDRLLASNTVKAERLPAVAEASGCNIAIPVKLSGILLADRTAVVLEPPVTVRCAMAGVVADWVRLDLTPLLASQGGLAKLSGLGGYACRTRDRIVGAKLSEHALGNAVDIGAFDLKTGKSVKVTEAAGYVSLFAAVKLTACARFATVLGPGADAYHKDHLHIDIEDRRHQRHLCQWQLP